MTEGMSWTKCLSGSESAIMKSVQTNEFICGDYIGI